MKPSISCQVLDKALLGIKDTVIGNFEIDLGYYSFFSKMSMRERLKVVLRNLKNSGERQDVYNSLNQIIRELDRDIRSQMSKISGTNIAAQSSSIKTEAYILNKVNTVGDKLAQTISVHKEKHKQDNNQRVINSNELQKALARNIAGEEITFTTPTARMINTNQFDDNEEMEEMMRTAREEIALVETEDNKEAYDEYADNQFVIKPKYKDRPSQSKRDEASTVDQAESKIADEEQPLKEKTNAEKMNLEEYGQPDQTKYRAVGYDSLNHRAKHYRLQLDGPLEDSEFTGKSIFNTIKIHRGKRIKSKKSWVERIFTSAEQFRVVGKFRGGIGVIDNNLFKKLEKLQLDDEFKKLDISYSKSMWENNKIDRDMLQTVKISTRVYILDAMIYESHDNNSKNDPYVKIKLGDFEINDSKNAIDNQNQPMFNQRYE